MRQQEVRGAIRKQPFEPFRIQLSNGQCYDVRHPELALLTRHSVHVVAPNSAEDDVDHVVQCDLVHVVAIEPLNGV